MKKSRKETEMSKAFPNHWITSKFKERICLNKNWSNIPEIIRSILDKSKLSVTLESTVIPPTPALHLLLACNFHPLSNKHIAFVSILFAEKHENQWRIISEKTKNMSLRPCSGSNLHCYHNTLCQKMCIYSCWDRNLTKQCHGTLQQDKICWEKG